MGVFLSYLRSLTVWNSASVSNSWSCFSKSHLPITVCFIAAFLISCAKPSESLLVSPTQDYCGSNSPITFSGLSEELGAIQDSLDSKTGVLVLEEGDQSMIFRAWFTEAAEKTIDIQYFIFSADNIGLIAIDYLLRAADRDVQVRMLVDDIMVETDADILLALDAHPNLSIKIYNPTANIGKNLPEKLLSLTSDFRGFNQRMHNKTFIVDNQIVITGGRNIADEYFDYDHEYNFRDRDVLLLGKTSIDVSNSFELFWNDPLSVQVKDLMQSASNSATSNNIFENLHQYACNPENFWPEVRTKINQLPAFFQKLQDNKGIRWTDHINYVSDLPGKNDPSTGLSGGGLTTDSLIWLLQEAKESIYIQSPYLVTTSLSQGLFEQAIKRGVQVKILTNSLTSTDNLEAFSGYRRERENLLALGIEIYELKPDASIRYQVMTGALQKSMNYSPVFGLHAKSMVIDQEISVIGTFNLDPRSANLNTECITIIHDGPIGQQLFQTMTEEMKEENAWKITSAFNPDNEASTGKRFQLWLRGVVPKSIL